MASIVLNIETIPRQSINKTVAEAVNNKVKYYIERTVYDPENTKSLIRSNSPFFGQVLCIGMC